MPIICMPFVCFCSVLSSINDVSYRDYLINMSGRSIYGYNAEDVGRPHESLICQI
jgi:hypothetical protein